ncbi:MAG: hypothetical protein AVDCRST_MAG90-712, partial [uncultured Microvirga sp.]
GRLHRPPHRRGGLHRERGADEDRRFRPYAVRGRRHYRGARPNHAGDLGHRSRHPHLSQGDPRRGPGSRPI